MLGKHDRFQANRFPLDGHQQAAGISADADVDVCIFGAGIAGLSTAYLRSGSGRSVLVLDQGPVGGGKTGRTTAHLSNALDDRYYRLERYFGQDSARYAAESHSAAIDLIVARESIDCGFIRLDGYLFAPLRESVEELQREMGAARRAGLWRIALGLGCIGGHVVLRLPRHLYYHFS